MDNGGESVYQADSPPVWVNNPSPVTTPTPPTPRGRSPSGRFRFKSKNIFLTYPRCPLEPNVVGEYLWTANARYGPLYIMVTRESHEDGSYHLHVLFQVEHEISTHNSRYFDICDHHPNIQTCRSAQLVQTYITKNIISQFTRGNLVRTSRGATKSTILTNNNTMRDIINNASSREDYLGMVRDNMPYDWATKLQAFEYSAKRLFPDTPAPYQNPFPQSELNLNCTETINGFAERLYTVSETAYFLGHSSSCTTIDQAKVDLNWMADFTRNQLRWGYDPGASTSAGQHGLANLPGPGA
ncbi:RepA [North American maize-associated mastrevirus]|nr:RepA [North American maize-associated mastrevirus]